MTVSDIPVLSFFKRLLNPVVMLSTLYLLTLMQNERFSGNYLVLAIIAFFISSTVWNGPTF